MKGMGICYSDQAIKVSNSHCSSPSNHYYSSSHLSSSILNAVTCIYKVKLSTEKQFLIKLTWLNQGFSIGITDYPVSSSKNNENSIVIEKVRGMKSFQSCSLRVEVNWDLCRAQYESGPEPLNGFYIMIFVNSVLSLILGDMDQEFEVKKRVSCIRKPEFTLVSRSEHFSGHAVYTTRAKFCEMGTCHDVMIKCVGEDGTTLRNPTLYVYIDKKNVVQVKRLQWNFRGNQTVFLDGLLVDLMWDVHDWFFSPSSLGNAVFLFRTRSGLDSRLWLDDKNFEQNEHENVGFSFLIFACMNPD